VSRLQPASLGRARDAAPAAVRAPASVQRVLSFPARYSAMGDYLWRIDSELPRVRRRDEVLVGLGEALAAAIVHGAFGLSCRGLGADVVSFLDQIQDAENSRGKALRVSVSMCVVGRSLRIIVAHHREDDAPTTLFDGRGLALVRRAFDEVRWDPVTNNLHLTIHGDA
jgi:hypothetical protein